jgi:hypothetical protein
MEHKRSTWDIKALNQGTYYLTGSTAAGTLKKHIKETDADGDGKGDGYPVIVNLTSTGNIVDTNKTSELSFSTWRMYKEKAFSGLGFSSTLFE